MVSKLLLKITFSSLYWRGGVEVKVVVGTKVVVGVKLAGTVELGIFLIVVDVE